MFFFFFFPFILQGLKKMVGGLLHIENMFNSFVYLIFFHFFYLTKQGKIAIHLPFSFHSPTFNSCPIKRTRNLLCPYRKSLL
jgi:hypothetical protein